MSAISYAKTMSLKHGEPAVVVFNAGTDDEYSLQTLRSEFEDLVSPLSTEISPVLVLGIPSIAQDLESGVVATIESFLEGAELSTFRYTPRL